MLRRSGREQLLGCVRVGERVARRTNLSIECRAKRRELRLSSASEGNRDGAKSSDGSWGPADLVRRRIHWSDCS